MSKGNRPNDVCALCDRVIDDPNPGFIGLHKYLGPGWVHGGGREYIAVHWGCAVLPSYDETTPLYRSILAALQRWVIFP
jgi:hypothetical protein